MIEDVRMDSDQCLRELLDISKRYVVYLSRKELEDKKFVATDYP